MDQDQFIAVPDLVKVDRAEEDSSAVPSAR